MENIAHPTVTQFTDIAFHALEQYNLVVQEVTFLQRSENVTFKITTPGDPYLLRLHKPLTRGMGTHGIDPGVIRSEMLWLDALRRNKMPVPQSVRNRHGEMVTRVNDANNKPVNCTVLEWLEGDLYTREMETEDSVAQIGNLVGRIHLHASRWRLPRGFQRPRRDAVYFMNVLESLQPAVDDGRIHYQDFKTLHTSIQGLAEMIQPVRKTRNTEGLIHGDLHRGNFLNRFGEIRLIDFSLCAFGHFTYDLGTCLSNVNPALHSIFLVNYDRLLPLPKNYDRLIEGFFIASYVVTFSFWLDNPDAQETLVQRVPYIAQEFATRFNRDERFWFKG
jgi:Ser/Thr protein kinase RdoA (MazF antagonist)